MDRLGQALAGGAHPRRISIFESHTDKNKGEANASPLFLVRVGRFELPAS